LTWEVCFDRVPLGNFWEPREATEDGPYFFPGLLLFIFDLEIYNLQP